MSKRRDAAQILALVAWVSKQLKRIKEEANARADVEFPDEKVKGHLVIDGKKVEISSTSRVQKAPKLVLDAADAESFARWVEKRWPTEVVPAVRQSFLSQLVSRMAASGGCLVDDDGVVCPFVSLESPDPYTTTWLLKGADEHLSELLGQRSLADLVRFIEDDVTDLDTEVQS